jgi:hypothetical protein
MLSPPNIFCRHFWSLPYNFRKKYGIGPWKIETDDQGEILIDDLGRNRKSMQRKKSIAPEINQLYINENQNPIQELIKAYDNVYPRLHGLLERGYREYVGEEYVDRVDIHDIEDWGTCDHEWENIIIHKIGVWYKCRKCFRQIAEEEFKRIFLN